jgi:hypothetical protein
LIRRWFARNIFGAMVGAVLDDRYRILRKLGEGAMGDVYLAEHLELGRRDAIKLLKADLAAEPDFIARFRREARAANRVRHPNIVGVHDFARLTDGSLILVMEYIEGVSLETLLQTEGALPAERTTSILIQLTDAMAHAHAAGVIHRDLKPANLLLTQSPDGREVLKVLDFGIAKIVAADYVTLAQTSEGEIFGTPLYMSPEQCSGRALDARSDLYSIGCVAFEMLTGEPPFVAANAVRIMTAHTFEPPRRPSECRPSAHIAAAFDALVLRCMEKDPAKRFPDAAALLRALRDLERLAPTAEALEVIDVSDPTTIDLPGSGARAAARANFGGLATTTSSRALALLLEVITLERDQVTPELIGAVEATVHLHEEQAQRRFEAAASARAIDEVNQRARDEQAQLLFALSELRCDQDAWQIGSAEKDALQARLSSVTQARDAELERLGEAQLGLTAGVADVEERFAVARRKLIAALRAQQNAAPALVAEPLRLLETVVAVST